MCFVSFIIPVYNLKEEELENCISSVANQTVDTLRYEVIIVDDGSNNGIEKMCDSLGKRCGAEVIHQQNQGLAAARNTGIRASRGEWIVHVDGDDWIDRKLVEELLLIQNIVADIVVWGYVYRNGEERRELLLKNKTAFETNYSEIKEKVLCSIMDSDDSFSFLALNTSWGKAYRRSFIERNGLNYDSSLRRAQDAVYNLYAFSKAMHVAYIDKALSYYRADNVSLSRGFNPKTFGYLQLTARAVDKCVSELNVSSKVGNASKVFIRRCFRMITVQSFLHKDNKQPYKERRSQFLKSIESEPFNGAFSSGVTRTGMANRMLDFLYMKKLFGCISLVNSISGIARHLKHIVKCKLKLN